MDNLRAHPSPVSRIVLEYHVGADMRVRLAHVIEPLLVLLPSYLMRLEVKYEADTHNLVEIGIQPEYRTAIMRVSAAFFAECEDYQRETITHEFIHVHVAPMADAFDALLDAAVPADTPLHTWAKAHMLAAEEGTVTDLTAAMLRFRDTSTSEVSRG